VRASIPALTITKPAIDRRRRNTEPPAKPLDGIPLSVPEIHGNEWRYVKECLDSGWVSSVGAFVTRFEEAVAEECGADYAVATTSGTTGLHTALLVVGIEPDEEVLLPTLTFIAPANAVRYVGAQPVFMDVEPDYWQMDAGKTADFLRRECRTAKDGLRNRQTGRRVRALLPVHILGHPVDMDPLLELARRYDLLVIEDASESIGAAYKGRPVGVLGDIGVFSFNGNKIITTGGGGMVATNNREWAVRARYLTTQAKDDPLEYIHKSVGYNYRLTNLQAAVGVAQMEQLHEYIAAKRAIARRYEAELMGLPGVSLPEKADWAESIWWLYTILADNERHPGGWRWWHERLKARGIETRPLWHPLHDLKIYRDCQAYRIEHAPEIQRRALSLPCSVGLSEEQQEYVIDAVRKMAGYGC
jgi:perosamine synthetase